MLKLRQDMSIGPNIRRARKNKGFTQEKTAIELQLMGIDISYNTYSKIETNFRNIRVSELVALSRIFGVDFNFFFDGLT